MPGTGHHFVNRRGRGALPTAGLHAAAGDVLRAAVVVGHVEAVEAGRGIVGHGGGGGIEVEAAAVALHVGDLPEAGDDAADVETGGEGDAFRNGHAALGIVNSSTLCNRLIRNDPHRVIPAKAGIQGNRFIAAPHQVRGRLGPPLSRG